MLGFPPSAAGQILRHAVLVLTAGVAGVAVGAGLTRYTGRQQPGDGNEAHLAAALQRQAPDSFQFVRESKVVGNEGLYIADHPVTDADLGKLCKADGASGWDGVVWVRTAAVPSREWGPNARHALGFVWLGDPTLIDRLVNVAEQERLGP